MLRGLATMIIVVVGLLIVNSNWGNLVVSGAGFMLLCIGSALINWRPPKKKKVKQVYSIYKCSEAACAIKELHEFKEGDYVYKTVGPCFKCNGELYIDQIFATLTKVEGQIKVNQARPENAANTSVETE
ncbi:MAG TPA: hypothetical protein VKM55_04955 [Candidatus Lokiarchaeia archaeon]|nr:hypothetical protein [Candidatus Lokiarchaeia archaeon]